MNWRPNCERFTTPAFAAGIVLILLFCTAKTYPAIKVIHEEKSPIVQAIDYIQNNLSPKKDIIYYDTEFYPFVNLYLKNFTTEALRDFRTGEVLPRPGMDIYVLGASYPEPTSTWKLSFKQLSPALAEMRYAAYYDAWLNKTDIVCFDFVPREEKKSSWMRGEGTCYLRNNDNSDKRLSIKAYVPVSYFQRTPTISIYLNDQLLEEFPQGTEEMLKEFSISGEGLAANTWSKLEMTIDQTFDCDTSDFAGEAEGNVSLILKDLAWADEGIHARGSSIKPRRTSSPARHF